MRSRGRRSTGAPLRSGGDQPARRGEQPPPHPKLEQRLDGPANAHGAREEGRGERELGGDVRLVHPLPHLHRQLPHHRGEGGHRQHRPHAERGEVRECADDGRHRKGRHHAEEVARAGAAVQDAGEQRRGDRLPLRRASPRRKQRRSRIVLARCAERSHCGGDRAVDCASRRVARRALVFGESTRRLHVAAPLARLTHAVDADDEDRDADGRLHVDTDRVEVERAAHQEGEQPHQPGANPVPEPPVKARV
mmetsp:Transcript_23869/g.70306  ORF Transcript_23869/g.70306 Transcript_23869/m.70306 type:complete len:250 (-) Transcript_23869:329-1078(-)